MALTTVAELRSTLGIGSLYTDATLQEVCDAADDVLLPMLWSNVYFSIAHSNTASPNAVGTSYFDFPTKDVFYVGQTVVIQGSGSKHNGSKTISSVGEFSISYSVNGNTTAAPYHPVNPYASVSGDTYVDYSTIAAVQEAALMISVDIFQARQLSNSGGVSPDFTPSPYRMGNTLMARIRGIIAPYLSPSGMVG